MRIQILGSALILLFFCVVGVKLSSSAAASRGGAPFPVCTYGTRLNCVIDGDTFWVAGEKIRIADIDTPEVDGRCDQERALAARATAELSRLLSEAPFELQSINRDADRYGRKLRLVMRGGQSVGDHLIATGVARPYVPRRRGWC